MSDAREPEPELDHDALAMLRAYRAEERIPAAVHERVWSRVEADVAPRGQWLRYGVVVGALAAAAMAVLWVGGQVLRSEPRAPASQAGYEHRANPPQPRATAPLQRDGGEPSPAQAERAASSGGALGPEGAAAPVGDPPDPASSSHDLAPPHADGSVRSGGGRRGTAGDDRRAKPHDEPAPTPAPGGTLAAENRLLAQARTALLDGQPEQALLRLGEHARRFPDGVLSEERQALRAVALCEAGRDTEGDAAARAFLLEHPHAALAQRVRSACRE
jgi:hypothetical protein